MSKKFISLSGVFFFALFILILFFGFEQSAHTDISWEQALKIYEVPFTEWVQVKLHVDYGASTENYSVSSSVRLINEKTRFIVGGSVANTEIGRQWYKNIGSKIEEDIARQCRIWTSQGYPISLNDFEINIKAPSN